MPLVVVRGASYPYPSGEELIQDLYRDAGSGCGAIHSRKSGRVAVALGLVRRRQDLHALLGESILDVPVEFGVSPAHRSRIPRKHVHLVGDRKVASATAFSGVVM